MAGLNSWSLSHRLMLKVLKELVKDALEPGPQCQWGIWFREEAKTIEQWNKEIKKKQLE